MTSPERELWSLVEPVHAIAYFAPTVAGALGDHGLHGFWNGYFAGHAAPLGAVGPEPVTALFFGFAPEMVARAVPKVWGRIDPATAVEVRLAAVDAMLAGLDAPDVTRAADVLAAAASRVATDGRALAAAWQGVGVPESPHARLWWATTVLREHRGDGHVLAATHAGLTGLQTTQTHIGAGVVTRATMQPNRGWTDAQWDAAAADLVARGVLTEDGALTTAGTELRRQVEADTDRLAHRPLALLADDLDEIRPALGALVTAIVEAGALPAGNPMGLPVPS